MDIADARHLRWFPSAVLVRANVIIQCLALIALGAVALALGRPVQSCCRDAWEIWLSAGTLLVSQTLPPMTDDLPMVIRPRMVAPA